ncbi:hypothetical protein [Niveispirillum sp. KHB5.9]|uniref:hypothetical protein n=1 Tax=Niveispirillum sp. KHB5.9 TaxID=3400269 RepID=UPI003A8AA7A7
MPLYQDDQGHLYWHDRIAATLAPVPPSEQQAAHGIWPKIARIRPGRARWLQRGCLGLMGAALVLAALSMPVASHDWPLSLGLAVLGFAVAAFAKLFFIDTLCTERVRFDRPLTLAPTQPWAPGLLRLGLVLSMAGPAHALFWAPGLDVMGGAGRSVFVLLLLAWLVWRQAWRWRRERKAIKLAVTGLTGSAATPPAP